MGPSSSSGISSTRANFTMIRWSPFWVSWESSAPCGLSYGYVGRLIRCRLLLALEIRRAPLAFHSQTPSGSASLDRASLTPRMNQAEEVTVRVAMVASCPLRPSLSVYWSWKLTRDTRPSGGSYQRRRPSRDDRRLHQVARPSPVAPGREGFHADEGFQRHWKEDFTHCGLGRRCDESRARDAGEGEHAADVPRHARNGECRHVSDGDGVLPERAHGPSGGRPRFNG